jgi:hypothetical protein
MKRGILGRMASQSSASDLGDLISNLTARRGDWMEVAGVQR